MADRVLTWHVVGSLAEGVQGTQRGETHYLDVDYFPDQVIVHLRTPSLVQETRIDINDDGTSIFTDGVRPSLTPGVNVAKTRHFGESQTRMLKGSQVTLDVDAVAASFPGADLTVHLELNRA